MEIHEKPVYLTPDSQKLSWKQFSKAFLNASPNGIAVTDRSFKTEISNKIAQAYLDIFTGTMMDVTLPELEDHTRRVLKYRITVRDVEIKRHKKKFITRISPIFWKEAVLGLLYIFQDVTMLEKISRKMRSFQELSLELDTIINSSHDGFWICDGQGKIIRINPASARLNGVDSELYIGKSIHNVVQQGIIDESVTLKVLSSKKKESIIQQTRNGKKLLITGTPVFDEKNNLFRVVVNERDITEIGALKKELEEKDALKDKLAEDLLEMQLVALESKKMIAKSASYKAVLEKAAKIARVDSTVLILGESGTGKGAIAEMIHSFSKRRDKPMIKLNCGAIPESLVESELFGYKKGAFTGADKTKPGRFEMADNGILFLDEIADLPLPSQVKLLRFLEDGYLSRIGDTASKRVNVRIIAATNQDLKAMVANKTFREDLYYRLKVIPIHLPPLRKRKECILPLAANYMAYFSLKHKCRPPVSLTAGAADAFESYLFPGNIRELINICERLVVLAENAKIHVKDLPESMAHNKTQAPLYSTLHADGRTFQEMMNRVEKQILTNVMETHHTQSEAARALGMNQSSIARKLQKHRLKPGFGDRG